MRSSSLFLVLLVVGIVGLLLAAPAYLDAAQGIATIKRDLYRQRDEGQTNVWLATGYVGPGLQRMETVGVEGGGDAWHHRRFRLSEDNSATWSDFQPLPDHIVSYQGTQFWEGEGAMVYDPTSGKLVNVWLRQVRVGSIYNNFSYYRLSDDQGRSWSEPKQFRYEPGADFDPEDPLNPAFLDKNQAYIGNNVLIRSDGKLVFAVGHANDPNDPQNDSRAWKMASLCFEGTWDAQSQDYVWAAGERVAISPTVSSRGLMEPQVAELKDGRIAVVWRGSNTSSTPGHKWFGTSTDGGLTLSEVGELKYDDGSQFYSPSSISQILRHSLTDKLYWVGNISPTPPSGNSPRYPLVIAEIDENNFSLKKDSVTVIDTRLAGDSSALQLSNFSLLENRETHDIEVYLTRWVPQDGGDVYRYTITLSDVPEPPRQP